MKNLALLFAVLTISMSVASAQDLSGNANGPGTRSAGSATGAVDVTGFRSPAELGPSQSSKFPNTREDLQHESGPAAHHDAGGIKVFSLEF